MEKQTTVRGHAAAGVTILIWGTTFISTKVLLREFTPIEILFIRFLMGYLVLWLVYPRKLVLASRRQEWYFAAAGLSGIALYYLLENIALTYTLASNVGVIISIAPFFTAVFSWIFLGGDRPGKRFLSGFVIAMGGIALISFSSEAKLAINPLGDILAVAAAVVWAAYSTITKKVSAFGYHVIQATRRTFFYGLIFMIPVILASDFKISLGQVTQLKNMGNLLFLGVGASAICFVTWNFGVKILGPVKTSVYIYMVPVITAVTSAIILGERIPGASVLGILMTLAGLLLSEGRSKKIEIGSEKGTGLSESGTP